MARTDNSATVQPGSAKTSRVFGSTDRCAEWPPACCAAGVVRTGCSTVTLAYAVSLR